MNAPRRASSRLLAVQFGFFLFGLILFVSRLHGLSDGAEPRPVDASPPPIYFVGGESVTPTPPTELVGPYQPIDVTRYAPSPTATITPTIAIPSAAAVRAAGPSGIPWFVPVEWHERYLACLVDPQRFELSEWVYRYSTEVREDGWIYGEAMAVAGREGGNDLCQFNTQGSTACGWFQTYYCAGLTAEEHMAAVWAKYLDGKRRNPSNPWFPHWQVNW